MRDLKNKLTSSKNTKNIQNRKGKMFGYQVLGFGSGGASAPPYPEATGGTVSETGNFRIHTFTGDGTFAITGLGTEDNSFQMDYLVVAGGGGGFTFDGNNGGYGGGAGGYREANATYAPTSPLGNSSGQVTLLAAGNFAVSVGAGGGRSGYNQQDPTRGGVSTIGFPSAITSHGGGSGDSGGSGSGGMPTSPSGKAGNTPPFSPPQGNQGSDSPSTSPPFNSRTGGGGGGATADGSGTGGGAGAISTISGSNSATLSIGGNGWPGSNGQSGGPNTGRGGDAGNPKTSNAGGGGSGLVAIRYRYQ